MSWYSLRFLGDLTPPVITFLSTWRLDPVAGVVIVAVGAVYAAGVVAARTNGHRWPLHRLVSFYVLGLGSYAWTCFGFLGAYSVELRWAFTTRVALLLFGVPWLLSLGQPVALARAALTGRPLRVLERFLAGRLMRVIGNAVFEPLFTLSLFLVFVTPFSATLRASNLAQACATVVIPLVALLMVVPVMEDTRAHSGFFITFEFILSFAALVFDAIPGILLRLNYTVLDRVPSVTGVLPSWFPNALHDQHLSGDFLWFLAEVADIPVIIILFIRWSRIDRHEAATVDELSDEEMEALTQAHLNRRPR